MADPNDTFNNVTPIENVLSVSEQIRNIAYTKDNDPEERMMLILMEKFNPFVEANFTDLQIKFGDNPEMFEARNYPVTDPYTPASIVRSEFNGAPYKKEYMQ